MANYVYSVVDLYPKVYQPSGKIRKFYDLLYKVSKLDKYLYKSDFLKMLNCLEKHDSSYLCHNECIDFRLSIDSLTIDDNHVIHIEAEDAWQFNINYFDYACKYHTGMHIHELFDVIYRCDGGTNDGMYTNDPEYLNGGYQEFSVDFQFDGSPKTYEIMNKLPFYKRTAPNSPFYKVDKDMLADFNYQYTNYGNHEHINEVGFACHEYEYYNSPEERDSWFDLVSKTFPIINDDKYNEFTYKEYRDYENIEFEDTYYYQKRQKQLYPFTDPEADAAVEAYINGTDNEFVDALMKGLLRNEKQQNQD